MVIGNDGADNSAAATATGLAADHRASNQRKNSAEQALRAVAGTLFARPWFDRAALFGLRNLF